MGLTLAKAAEWTSAQGGSGGKLESTPMNQSILDAIMTQITGYTGKNPEQGKVVFKHPLTWVSTLGPSDVGSSFTTKDGETVSAAVDKDNKPLVVFRPTGKDNFQVSARSLEQLEMLLSVAGDRKMAELRACLEANRDPVARMLGDRFSTVLGEDGSIYRFTEEIMKTEDSTDPEVLEKKYVLKMALEFRDLDIRMMRDSLTKITDNVRLNPRIVEDEVNLLTQFVGKKEDDFALLLLEPVRTYSYLHQNGCRAPPWRQLHGEIAYFRVHPHDIDEFSVTASTDGWFFNEGLDPVSNDLQFEKQGDQLYKSLITLLKEKSPKFAEFVTNAKFKQTVDQKALTQRDATMHRGGDDDRDSDRGSGRDDDRRRGEGGKKGEAGKKKKAGGQRKKKLEPSLKWKELGLTRDTEDEEKEKAEKKKEKKPVPKKKETRRVHHGDTDIEDSFSESSSESEEEEETPDRRHESNSDLPSEYWQISKLVKYLKSGNQTSTIISLCALRDFPLHTEVCQLAVRDVGGLEILINLLETGEVRCKIGSLKILKEISRNPQIRRAIADLGGLQTMVKILQDPNRDLKCLSAETIANVAKFRRARRTVRKHGGIRKLVTLLDCPSLSDSTAAHDDRDIEVSRCGALALWSCSKSTKTKMSMKRAGVIPLLAKLLQSLQSKHEDMLIPVVGTLQECASEHSYSVAIRTEGMIEYLVKNLKSSNPELQMHCASTIFKCAQEKETRDLVRNFGGLDPLVHLLGSQDNKELLAAATGAIWKCAISPENIQRFQELDAISKLVQLLNNQPEEVLINVVGALGEMASDPANRAAIRKSGGVAPLVHLLTGTNRALLVNVTRAVGQCGEEPENMIIIDKLDGVRLLWSLLKNPRPEVQSSAAWAICPCIENAKDAGELVRSFVGGLELIVSLLKSHDLEVLASVCAAIANIAKDEENLAVITDHGVVNMLAKLTDTADDRLRRHLAEAISRCCSWGKNREDFGKAGAVAPLVKYLRSSDVGVHRSTARALFQLSKHPENCKTMHEAGVVKLLLGMVGAADEVLQEAAAGCIGNIRRLALANEKADQSESKRRQATSGKSR